MNSDLRSQRIRTTESWLKFLNPESLRTNLIAASLYLSAYETLRSTIIDQVRSFFVVGFSGTTETISGDYKLKVTALHSSLFKASTMWLEQMGAIDDEDVQALDAIREHRNEIAHGLPSFVASAGSCIDNRLFEEIYKLVSKIDCWWITEVEIPMNPDLCDKAVELEGIQSGNMIFLQLLTQIAAGEPENASYYYNAFKQQVANHDSKAP